MLFYDKKTEVDFNDFSVFYYVVVMFNRFGDIGNGIATALNEEQFGALLDDEFFPVLIKAAL